MGLVCSCVEGRDNKEEVPSTIRKGMMCTSGREKVPPIEYEDCSRPYYGNFDYRREDAGP